MFLPAKDGISAVIPGSEAAAQLCGKETERASSINAVTTVASAVTLPAVALAAQMLLI